MGDFGTPEQRETIARRFHEEYEWLASAYGWVTQEASRVAWADLPEHQRKLMLHVVENLLASDVIAIEARPRDHLDDVFDLYAEHDKCAYCGVTGPTRPDPFAQAAACKQCWNQIAGGD